MGLYICYTTMAYFSQNICKNSKNKNWNFTEDTFSGATGLTGTILYNIPDTTRTRESQD